MVHMFNRNGKTGKSKLEFQGQYRYFHNHMLYVHCNHGHYQHHHLLLLGCQMNILQCKNLWKLKCKLSGWHYVIIVDNHVFILYVITITTLYLHQCLSGLYWFPHHYHLKSELLVLIFVLYISQDAYVEMYWLK